MSDKERIAKLESFLRKSKRRYHRTCNDSWYSCPKSEDGCPDDQWDINECNCGADEWNAKVETLLGEES